MNPTNPMSQFRNAALKELPDNPPMSFDDLTRGEQQEKTVFNLADELADLPDVLDLWKTMVEAANALPGLRVNGGTIRAKNTPLMVKKKIEQAQIEYNKARYKFHRLMNGRETGEQYRFMYSSYLDWEEIEWDQDLADELADDSDD